MQFKVGDQIKIKGDLEKGIKYGSLEANEGMCALKGKVSTITSQVYDTYCRLDGYDYLWTEEMLEPVVNAQDQLIKELNSAKYDNEMLHKINNEISSSVNTMQDEFAQICKTIFECGNKIKSLSATATQVVEEPPSKDEQDREKLKSVIEALLTYMNNNNA